MTVTDPQHRCAVAGFVRRRGWCFGKLVATRGNVAKLRQQGRSLEETIAANPTVAFDAKWGEFVISPDHFTRLYHGVY
jgi:hypothetical protein